MIQVRFCRSFAVVSVVLAIALLEGSSNATTLNTLDRTNQNWTSLDHEEITTNIKLTQIDVSDNNITELNSTMLFGHRYLEVLILSGNRLYDFPPNASFLSSISLERFECRSCGITTIFNATFTELSRLRELDLSGNDLSTIEPAAFSTHFFLRKLNFDDNKLTSLPVDILKQSKVNASITMNNNSAFNFQPHKVFIKSKILTQFRCSRCNISTLYDETFSELPNIESIELNNNKISTIDAKMFKNNRKIISLSIEQNDLTDFPRSVFDPMPSLQSLCIDGNPFVITAKNAFRTYYARFSYRKNCTEVDGKNFFENNLNPAEPTKNKGISDAFIATYLIIILVAQAAVIGGLVLYYFKIVFTDKDDEFDYSSNVLNDHDIYNVS